MLVALVLLIAVLAVCVSPAVDLPETVLRSKQYAVLIAMALIAVATMFTGVLVPLPSIVFLPRTGSEVSADPLALNAILPLLC